MDKAMRERETERNIMYRNSNLMVWIIHIREGTVIQTMERLEDEFLLHYERK